MAGDTFKKTGNLVVRQLGAVAAGLTRLQTSLYSQPDPQIIGVSDANFPTALQPVRPFGNENTKPLGMNLQMGQNLIFTPRPDARYTAPELQMYASYPLARICIEMVKNIVAAMPWKIQLRSQPGENRKEREAKQLKDDTILTLTDFFNHPNADESFGSFTRRVFEDMLVCDAASILLRRDRNDGISELRALEGAYITRLVTDQGYTPQPPSPAYQQLWEGMPLNDLTTDQLIYRPRNICYRVGTISYSLYGLSPTEMLAQEIEVGMQRLQYVTAFYRDGSVPNVLWVVPPEATPDKVEQGMKILNSKLAGNLEGRRQIQFAQGYVEKGEDKIHQFKEPELADSYDDLHIRKMAAGYGVSAQRLLKLQTHATSQSNQEAAEEEGIAPYLDWYSDVLNEIIQNRMGHSKYEFLFDTSRDPDPTKQAVIDASDVKGGIETINGARIRRGWDTIQNPAADVLAITTAQGRVPIEQAVLPPTTKGAGAAPAPTKPALPAGDPDNKGDGNADPTGKMHKAANMAVIDPARESIRVRNDKSRIQSVMSNFFHHVADNIVIVHKPLKKVRKSDPPNHDKDVEAIVNAIMDSVEWGVIPSAIEEALEDAGLDGASVGLDQVERMEEVESGKPITLSAQPVRVVTQAVISETNRVAMDYARMRSAELVGMKYVDGELIENPSAKWAITTSTRSMLRDILTTAFEKDTPLNELTQRIKDAGVFSDERARTIANTEIAFAQVGGNYAAWQKSGFVQTVKWSLSANHDHDDECDENVEAGEIKIGDAFPSGQLAPPAHPNCVCGITPVKIGGLSQKW